MRGGAQMQGRGLVKAIANGVPFQRMLGALLILSHSMPPIPLPVQLARHHALLLVNAHVQVL